MAIPPILIKAALEVGKIAGQAAIQEGVPEVKKALDRQHEHNKELILVPSLIGTDFDEARKILEKLGFSVLTKRAEPDKRWVNKRPNEVVNMEPKAGRLHPTTVIKLHYVDAEVIDQSDGEVELPILKDMMIDDAISLVEKKGLLPAKVLAKPKLEFAKEKSGTVVDSDPKPNFLNKVAKTGTTIRIIYLDETVIAESLELLAKEETKRQEFQHNIDNGIKEVQKNVDKGIKDVQKVADDVLGNIGNLFNKKVK